jgi:hypothetical protein
LSLVSVRSRSIEVGGFGAKVNKVCVGKRND